MTVWEESQRWEAAWWGKCVNTYGEETKQLTYAHRMGLRIVPDAGHWPVYDLEGKAVADLGGGPVSILLKCKNFGRVVVVDPCPYPGWVQHRYAMAGVEWSMLPAEEYLVGRTFDECWIYNVLQHVIDPERIIRNARTMAKVIRIFEWINLPPHQGHPHELKADKLNQWLGGRGTIEQMDENGCGGRAYYGAFSI